MSVRDWTPAQVAAVLQLLRGKLRRQFKTASTLGFVPAAVSGIRDPMRDLADLVESCRALDLVDVDLDQVEQFLESAEGGDEALEALGRVREAVEARRA